MYFCKLRLRWLVFSGARRGNWLLLCQKPSCLRSAAKLHSDSKAHTDTRPDQSQSKPTNCLALGDSFIILYRNIIGRTFGENRNYFREGIFKSRALHKCQSSSTPSTFYDYHHSFCTQYIIKLILPASVSHTCTASIHTVIDSRIVPKSGNKL